ncbi:MAG TPA: DUF1844 domain-containing protein [Desulfomonilia bacterium]|nr:DUF1844 domain-containing protein [Desulfomonilia bacterium]
MEDEKKEEKKGYTFMDKRGLDKDSTEAPQVLKNPDAQPQEEDKPRGPIPAIDFTTLIMSFASAALVSMGRVSDPALGTVQKNLVVAQQNIDIINLLHEKTKGNLTADEGHLMEQILYELRMCYVEAMKEEK